MSKAFEKFSDFYHHQDFLKEAAHRTAKRLSAFFGHPVDIEYLGIRQGSISEVFVNPKELSAEAIGAVFMSEKMRANFFIVFTPFDARRIVDLCYGVASGKPGDHKKDGFDERAKSVITEVGNLLAGAFFSGLSDSTGIDIDFGAPGYVEDLLGAALDSLCGKTGMETALLSKAEIKINIRDVNLSGTVFIVGV